MVETVLLQEALAELAPLVIVSRLFAQMSTDVPGDGSPFVSPVWDDLVESLGDLALSEDNKLVIVPPSLQYIQVSSSFSWDAATLTTVRLSGTAFFQGSRISQIVPNALSQQGILNSGIFRVPHNGIDEMNFGVAAGNLGLDNFIYADSGTWLSVIGFA